MFRRFCPILILLFLNIPAFGWHVNTHLQMTRDAVALMPADFKKTFVEHQKFVESGIKDPDELIKDWPNHYYIPATNEGGAITRIDQIISVVQTKFKNSNQLDVSKQLCYLAHYIGDLWSPEYLPKGNTMPDIDFTKNNQIYVLWEGYSTPIDNLHDYFMKRAIWKSRLETDKSISTLLYSEAVNDIARTWLTLWQQSGHTVEPIAAGLIEHKIGSLNINWNQMMMEEEYIRPMEEFNPADSWQSQYELHQTEMAKNYENANPSEETYLAKSQARMAQEKEKANNPSAQYKMLESSMRTIGDKAYFVARVRNAGSAEIGSLAFMYPGVKGPVGMIRNLKPGEVAKVDAVLPANSTKDKIQLIFSAAQ